MANGDYNRYVQEEAAARRKPVTLSAWQKRERKRKNPPLGGPLTETPQNRVVRAYLTASGLSVERKPTKPPGGPVTTAQSPLAAKTGLPRCRWWEERIQKSKTHGDYPLQVRCSLVRGHEEEEGSPHWHDRRDFDPEYQFEAPWIE